jgi:hypothetical protein
MQTFGDHVNQFAQTVDIVPETVYYEVLNLIQDYLKENLKAGFFAVAVEKVVRLQPYLVAEWPCDRPWWSARVKDDKGIYMGQTSLAYALGKPLWIVGAQKEELSKASTYADLLNNAGPTEIPRYEEIDVINAKTSIILPLKVEDNHFGIVNIESKDYMLPTEAWFYELNKLASAIAILHQLKNINRLQTKSTLEAKDRLEHGEFVPVVKRRIMFFASSSRADDEVVGIINEVLDGFKHSFEVVPWTDPITGNIHQNIWERISGCMFGVCYFSEPAEHAEGYRFVDNPNVLFEAGMLYALRKAKRSPLQGVVLVREANAPHIPFDLSAESMIVVPRLANGNLNGHLFRNLLEKHLSFILNISNTR